MENLISLIVALIILVFFLNILKGILRLAILAIGIYFVYSFITTGTIGIPFNF